MIRLRAIKIRVNSGERAFGYECLFSPGFNVIRADNSRGKSTLFAGIVFGLGFEELLGGRNELALPNALSKIIDDPETGESLPVTSSEVWLEYEGAIGIATNRRSVSNDSKSPKLVEVYSGPMLTEAGSLYPQHDYYLHDKNSAQSVETGYFAYIESFLQLTLPNIVSPDGSSSKLYIQYLAAASLIEQRLGWTTYIANLPYFGIKDAKQRVIEFLLGLKTFNRDIERRKLQHEYGSIEREWAQLYFGLKSGATNLGMRIVGISESVDLVFSRKTATVIKITEKEPTAIEAYLEGLEGTLAEISAEQQLTAEIGIDSERIGRLTGRTSELISLDQQIEYGIRSSESERDQLLSIIRGFDEDLQKNKGARKIRELGGDFSLKHSRDTCPLCLQHISDDVYLPASAITDMSIEDNIVSLESQKRIAQASIGSIERSMNEAKIKLGIIQKELDQLNKELGVIKRESVQRLGAISESTVYKKVSIMSEIESIRGLMNLLAVRIDAFEELAKKANNIAKDLRDIAADKLSQTEQNTIKHFETTIRELIARFGFSSFSPRHITIDQNRLTPVIRYGDIYSDLDGGSIEAAAKKIDGGPEKVLTAKTETGSSASDFVRLNWAFTMALRSVFMGDLSNHPGLVLMDEPQQHSMNNESMRELFRVAETSPGQTIIAASFDCSDENYEQITKGIEFTKIEIQGKLLKSIAKV